MNSVELYVAHLLVLIKLEFPIEINSMMGMPGIFY